MLVLERGWLSSNNIVFTGGEAPALIDSGYSTHSTQTVGLVQSALQGQPLQLLLNTHLHSDHCGGNAALQQRFGGLRTLIPPGLADAVRRWDESALTYAPTGQTCDRFNIDDIIVPGQSIRLGARTWEVHAAPGHDPHSVILFEPESRVLISADALWESGFGVVFPELEGDHAFAAVGDTLDLIEALAPLLIVPGHGAVFSNVGLALERARGRLAAFRADPARHALHASKVLLKFKLLELQRVLAGELVAWAAATPYFSMVHGRWFGERSLREWIEAVLADLIRGGAAVRRGEFLANT